ncbi:hypothetical protein BKA57DRAFT_474757 [Linnemannia elongata]|nr:hypothetical protein BKA57DRAFT_474757 [Linnemannia elongata]
MKSDKCVKRQGGLLFVCFGFVVGRSVALVDLVVVVAQRVLLLMDGRLNRIALLLFIYFHSTTPSTRPRPKKITEAHAI